MQITRDIAYAPAHGERGLLDIWQPDAPGRPIVVVIHGGGLQSLRKERMDGVSAFLARQGWVAVNVNYRLLPAHSFPAPLEDVLSAVEWVASTEHEDLARHDRSRMALLGASAGGYLAMAAGFLLGMERLRAVVTISGPATRERRAPFGEGCDPRLLLPPVELADAGAPPLLAVHSRNDELVRPEESVAVVERLRALGRPAELYLFDGPGKLHGIWDEQDATSPNLLPPLEDAIAAFLRARLDGEPR